METPVAGKASTAKAAPATERPKSARSRSGSALGKVSAARKPRGASAAGKTRKSRAGAVSDEDIRLRAYFIAERRMLSGIPGDSAHDWLEARRQLQEEAGKSA